MEKTVAPANISPLIKGARWGLLVLGLIYGSSRYNMLYNRKQRQLEELERTRPEREAKEAAAKAKLVQDQLEDLSRQFGSKI